jgi:hypothetical protein
MAPAGSNIADTSAVIDGWGLVGLDTPDIVNRINVLALNDPFSFTVRTCPLDIEASPLMPKVKGDKNVNGEAEEHAKPTPDKEITSVL